MPLEAILAFCLNPSMDDPQNDRIINPFPSFCLNPISIIINMRSLGVKRRWGTRKATGHSQVSLANLDKKHANGSGNA